MVRHDDMRNIDHVREVTEQFPINTVDHLACGVQYHLPVVNVSETAHSALSDDGYEDATLGGIVEAL